MNLVNLESVSVAYGPKPLLDEVSLGVEEGDRIGVVGRNGGGKTTLISVLAGALRPDSGRATRFGRPTSSRRGRVRRTLDRDELA